MARPSYPARVTGPVVYRTARGRRSTIPLGPCLVEPRDEALVDIFWGANGQNGAALPLGELEQAEHAGHLVRLDRSA